MFESIKSRVMDWLDGGKLEWSLAERCWNRTLRSVLPCKHRNFREDKWVNSEGVTEFTWVCLDCQASERGHLSGS